MEELLNKLIEKGWKPFNREKTLHITCYDKCKGLNYKWVYLDGGFMNEESRTLRELVSIDSGLWQFVCENDLVEYDTESGWGEFSFNTNYINGFYGKHIFENNYQYRLIEASLKDESELEDFLLQNIVIKDE